MWLEQGREHNPSPQAQRALAAALLLEDEETAYLRAITNPPQHVRSPQDFYRDWAVVAQVLRSGSARMRRATSLITVNDVAAEPVHRCGDEAVRTAPAHPEATDRAWAG